MWARLTVKSNDSRSSGGNFKMLHDRMRPRSPDCFIHYFIISRNWWPEFGVGSSQIENDFNWRYVDGCRLTKALIEINETAGPDVAVKTNPIKSNEIEITVWK